VPDDPVVPEEDPQERPRRRPMLLMMLVAAALLVAVAGTGVVGGGGGASGNDSAPAQSRPADQLQSDPGAGMTRRGRHCHHDGGGSGPQTAPSADPPV